MGEASHDHGFAYGEMEGDLFHLGDDGNGFCSRFRRSIEEVGLVEGYGSNGGNFAEEGAEEGGFSGAVFAEDCEDLTGVGCETEGSEGEVRVDGGLEVTDGEHWVFWFEEFLTEMFY